MGGIPCGRNPCEGGILCVRNPMWEESRLGGILLGGVSWEESCLEEFYDYRIISLKPDDDVYL